MKLTQIDCKTWWHSEILFGHQAASYAVNLRFSAIFPAAWDRSSPNQILFRAIISLCLALIWNSTQSWLYLRSVTPPVSWRCQVSVSVGSLQCNSPNEWPVIHWIVSPPYIQDSSAPPPPSVKKWLMVESHECWSTSHILVRPWDEHYLFRPGF